MKVKKLERNGNIAVLYSPGYGAGWYSWQTSDPKSEAMLFDPDIVLAVEAEDFEKVMKIATRRYKNMYLGGAKNLAVYWVPKGARFEITEYDGNEGVKIFSHTDGITA